MSLTKSAVQVFPYMLQLRVATCCVRWFCSRSFRFPKRVYSCQSAKPIVSDMVKILNVAEKNDAAKNIAKILSRDSARMRDGFSKYNKIYEFPYMLSGQQCTMTMTSVSGHLLHLEFGGQYRIWKSCNPVTLFEAPVTSQCLPDYEPIKRTLEREVRGASKLIIWTDCDREGEGIGSEIIEVCKLVKPHIDVYRARFSEITQQSITRALQNLGRLDQRISDAVFVRIELDLRIGAAFTRFQTLRFQKVFPTVLANSLISYGSCQFPTLGFVVERYKQIMDFVEEPFWKISVTHNVDDEKVTFVWHRDRLFDHQACLILYQLCEENQLATVIDVESKPKSKWRPLPLDTVELEKAASRKLHINAIETMKIAEKLYVQGLISYPRTETNIFPKELELVPLVQHQTQDPAWGEFAQRVINDGPDPRSGKKSDQAHPPIHPTKYTNSLHGNDKKVYDFIVRHFLACLSKNAEGYETTVVIQITEEKFTATGLMIIAKNYLEVYPYEKWSDKSIPIFQVGQTFIPTAIEMNQGHTSPPSLLTEADLISLMEKHGIGTDATHAEHIEKIKDRAYVGVQDGKFMPGELGMGLVEGYDAMGFAMSKPHLRADLEADLRAICEGTKDPKVALADQISRYREVFVQAVEQVNKIDVALAHYLKHEAQPMAIEAADTPINVMKCPRCGMDMMVKKKKSGTSFFISCMGYPQCKSAMWLPEFVKDVKESQEFCAACRPRPVRKLKFTLERGSMPAFYPTEYLGCVGGCDQNFLMSLGVTLPLPVQNPTLNHLVTPVAPRDPHANAANRTHHFQQPLPPTTTNGPTRRQPGLLPYTTPRTAPPGAMQASNTDNDEVCKCTCGVPAIQLTVRKEGINQGRKFYKCPDNRCDFFSFVTDDDRNTGGSGSGDVDRTPVRWPAAPAASPGTSWSTPRGTFHNNPPPARGNPDLPPPNCNCGIQSRQLTVQKEGQNKGRKFFRCSKSQDNGPCNFFKFDEGNEDNQRNAPAADGGWNQRGAGSGGGGGGQPRTADRPTAGTARAKRKCSICGQEGHNKNKCPRNR